MKSSLGLCEVSLKSLPKMLHEISSRMPLSSNQVFLMKLLWIPLWSLYNVSLPIFLWRLLLAQYHPTVPISSIPFLDTNGMYWFMDCLRVINVDGQDCSDSSWILSEGRFIDWRDKKAVWIDKWRRKKETNVNLSFWLPEYSVELTKIPFQNRMTYFTHTNNTHPYRALFQLDCIYQLITLQ